MDRKPFLPSVLFALAIVFILGLAAPTAWGQTVAGTIVGTVTDRSGASIPNAKVVVTNLDTGVHYNATTSESGDYVVPFLPPGRYSVSVAHEGFERKVVSELDLQVEQRARADVVLNVGQLTQTVEVSGQAPLLNTDTAEVGQVIGNKEVEDLPLNGRQFMELSLLEPGVHASGPGNFNEILQGFAVSGGGGRPTGNNFTLDGVDNVSPNCGYFSVSPSLDAVQEFKIQTSDYSAEFGRTAGVVVNVATKSGTNQLHGTLFEFVRNNDLGDSRNLFSPSVEQIRRNQFGGNIGGPVDIPGVYNGKNKTFFFWDQEYLREVDPTAQVGRVPTVPETTGDFSQAGYTIYDPATTSCNAQGVCTRTQFPGNIIPTNRLNQVALNALTYYPQPNNPSDPLANFVNVTPVTTDTFQDVARVDHQFSPNDNFFARYAESTSKNLTPGVLPHMDDDLLSFAGVNVAANWVRTFSPSLVNEFRAGYNRLNFGRVSPRQGSENFAAKLGITGVPGGKTAVFPIFGIDGYTGLGDIEPYGNIDNIFQLVDMATKTRGRQSVKFGVDVRRVESDYYITRAPSGSYDLSGGFTDEPGQYLPDGLADFLLGLPDTSAITYVSDIGRTRTTNVNAFVQDDWRATPNLTVNLGLRYEVYTPPVDKFGRQGYLDPSNGVMTYVKNAPLNNPIPGQGITEQDLKFPFTTVNRNSIMIGDNNNFAPRIGLAYKLPFSPNTVIRTGYGVSYVYMPFSEFGVMSQRLEPFSVQVYLTSSPSGLPTIPNYNFPVGGAAASLEAGLPIAEAGVAPNFHWGDVQQYNFDIQHQAHNWLFDVGYMGNVSHHLAQRFPTNIAPIGPGPIQSRVPWPDYAESTQDQSDINADYNGLLTRVEKRFSKGFALLVTYTYAKSMDDSSEVYQTPGQDNGPQVPDNYHIERGLAPDDVRHRITAMYLWELPFGNGKRYGPGLPKVANFLASGWQFNSIITYQSGFHFEASGGAYLNNGLTGRPDQICNPNKGFKFSVNEAFNTNCFVTPPPYTLGTAAPGSIATHPSSDVDFGLMKNNKVGEHINVQFRWEVFNLANHPNFTTYAALPYADESSAMFGEITGADPPRLMQVGLKLIF